MFSGSLQKDLFKGRWSLAKNCFKQNYCHACRTRFAVFFPLPSCCVSVLNWLIKQQNGNVIWRRVSARKGRNSTSGTQLPLCHWSIQLFDLRAQSSTDVPVLLLTQPNQSTATTTGTSKTLQILWALCITLFSTFLCRPWRTTTWNYKCPNFELTWERERQGDEFYYLSLNSDAVPSLQSQPNFPTFK